MKKTLILFIFLLLVPNVYAISINKDTFNSHETLEFSGTISTPTCSVLSYDFRILLKTPDENHIEINHSKTVNQIYDSNLYQYKINFSGKLNLENYTAGDYEIIADLPWDCSQYLSKTVVWRNDIIESKNFKILNSNYNSYINNEWKWIESPEYDIPNFYKINFDDSSWKENQLPMGQHVTKETFWGTDNALFRKEFNLNQITDTELILNYETGAVCYVNEMKILDDIISVNLRTDNVKIDITPYLKTGKNLVACYVRRTNIKACSNNMYPCGCRNSPDLSCFESNSYCTRDPLKCYKRGQSWFNAEIAFHPAQNIGWKNKENWYYTSPVATDVPFFEKPNYYNSDGKTYLGIQPESPLEIKKWYYISDSRKKILKISASSYPECKINENKLDLYFVDDNYWILNSEPEFKQGLNKITCHMSSSFIHFDMAIKNKPIVTINPFNPESGSADSKEKNLAPLIAISGLGLVGALGAASYISNRYKTLNSKNILSSHKSFFSSLIKRNSAYMKKMKSIALSDKDFEKRSRQADIEAKNLSKKNKEENRITKFIQKIKSKVLSITQIKNISEKIFHNTTSTNNKGIIALFLQRANEILLMQKQKKMYSEDKIIKNENKGKKLERHFTYMGKKITADISTELKPFVKNPISYTISYASETFEKISYAKQKINDIENGDINLSTISSLGKKMINSYATSLKKNPFETILKTAVMAGIAGMALSAALSLAGAAGIVFSTSLAVSGMGTAMLFTNNMEKAQEAERESELKYISDKGTEYLYYTANVATTAVGTKYIYSTSAYKKLGNVKKLGIEMGKDISIDMFNDNTRISFMRENLGLSKDEAEELNYGYESFETISIFTDLT